MRTADEILMDILCDEDITDDEWAAYQAYCRMGPEEPPTQGPLLMRRHGLSRN